MVNDPTSPPSSRGSSRADSDNPDTWARLSESVSSEAAAALSAPSLSLLAAFLSPALFALPTDILALAWASRYEDPSSAWLNVAVPFALGRAALSFPASFLVDSLPKRAAAPAVAACFAALTVALAALVAWAPGQVRLVRVAQGGLSGAANVLVASLVKGSATKVRRCLAGASERR
jgi:hypothetical protein